MTIIAAPLAPLREPNGFTLIEVLVVIAIMALVAGLVFPRVDRLLDTARFASARTTVSAAAQAARAEAVRTDSMVVLQASGDNRSLLSNGRTVVDLPSPILVHSVDGVTRFFGDGSATSGGLRLVAGRRRSELRILSPTGITQWQ